MAVFYSFHYERDVHRVQLIENMGALEGQAILNHQEWEKIKNAGERAIQNWISDQMKWKSAVVVLIGNETASRDWVQYEIQKAWNERKPLLGIRIHGLSSMGDVDSPGNNPFTGVSGLSQVPVFDPTQKDWNGNIDSKATYNYLSDHLKEWADQGITADERVSDSLCAGAWFTSSPRIGRGMPRLVG
ncbi:MAG TPA: TIR domain-containing protein [Enteractinococcus sp.]